MLLLFVAAAAAAVPKHRPGKRKRPTKEREQDGQARSRNGGPRRSSSPNDRRDGPGDPPRRGDQHHLVREGVAMRKTWKLPFGLGLAVLVVAAAAVISHVAAPRGHAAAHNMA